MIGVHKYFLGSSLPDTRAVQLFWEIRNILLCYKYTPVLCHLASSSNVFANVLHFSNRTSIGTRIF